MTRGAAGRAAIGLGLVVATLGLHAAVGPTTEEVLTSLWVWLPGVIGLTLVVFSAVPDLVELGRYRLTVVEPARRFGAIRPETPPVVDPTLDLDPDES